MWEDVAGGAGAKGAAGGAGGSADGGSLDALDATSLVSATFQFAIIQAGTGGRGGSVLPVPAPPAWRSARRCAGRTPAGGGPSRWA